MKVFFLDILPFLFYCVYMGDKGTKTVSMRMPESLWKKIKDEANTLNRSIGAQIVFYLMQIYDEIEPKKIPQDRIFNRSVDSTAEPSREEGRETDTDAEQEGGAASNILG